MIERCHVDQHLLESSTGGLANARPPKSQKRDECSEGKKRYKYATEVAKQQ
jgi:hypothetical protein